MKLSAPFPWFGGKRKVAKEVWRRLGEVDLYVEPFFGSGAVLLARPDFNPVAPPREIVNDKDGLLVNFWRAIKWAPEEVAYWASWPITELDYHARHMWLVQRAETLARELEANPEFFDPKAAGWWAWGAALHIGGGWCSGKGPWKLVHGGLERVGEAVSGPGISKALPKLRHMHTGVLRRVDLVAWFKALSERLRHVRVANGDWKRVLTHGVLIPHQHKAIGVFLDPPYSVKAGRSPGLYREDDFGIAKEVQKWALEHGEDHRFRIALCGYTGEHDALASAGWVPYYWTASGGYGVQSNGRGRKNRQREVIWFSPGCHHGNLEQ